MTLKSILLLLATASVAAYPAIPSEAQVMPMDIRTFIHIRYYHGIPYEQASHFEKSAVPVLLDMLKDPQEQKWWSNIIDTLGIIGDNRATAPLITFMEHSTRGEVDIDTWSALLQVYPAIGSIAAKGSQPAMKYLILNAKPETWKDKSVPWTFGHKSSETIADHLMISAIMGLGFSACTEAEEALKQMKNIPGTKDWFKSAIKDALNLSVQIRKQGRDKVFGKGGH